MVRFDNPQMEELCKFLLTDPKEYRLKIIGHSLIPTRKEQLEYLEQQEADAQENLFNIRKAISIGRMAMLLNAKLKDDDEEE